MDSQNALISVIVPIYMIERYIGICIESILNQTYKNLEIILVDDGSKDRCPEICDLYASKDSRIKVVHKPNGGLVSARKAGLEASHGEYIGYVDGDDWVGPGYYEALYNEIRTSGADVVCAGQSRDLFSKSVSFINSYPMGIYTGDRLDELKKNMLSYGAFYRPGITTYVWNKLFKREIVYKHQMNVDERITIGEDAAVTYPVLMDCSCVSLTDNVAYHYRQREDSMLKKLASFSQEAEKLSCLYEYLSSFAVKCGSHELSRQVNDYVLANCIMRSGAKLPDGSYSAFSSDYFGKRVVIHCAGTFGQQLMNRFNESRHCSVVGWIDDDYWEYRRCCLDVDSVESITKIDYDYVLIANVDPGAVQSITRQLLDLGVSKAKILTVLSERVDREALIQKYLY